MNTSSIFAAAHAEARTMNAKRAYAKRFAQALKNQFAIARATEAIERYEIAANADGDFRLVGDPGCMGGNSMKVEGGRYMWSMGILEFIPSDYNYDHNRNKKTVATGLPTGISNNRNLARLAAAHAATGKTFIVNRY